MPDGSPSIGMRFATKYGIHPRLLFLTLRETAFKQDEGKEANDAQLFALLVVADQYGLNPFTREIFAFFDKRKGVIPVVSIDGWVRIINGHPNYDGVEFIYSDEMVEAGAGTTKKAHVWVEAVIYRKDIGRPIRVREYLDEVYQPPRNGYNGPWQSHPKRFQRHKVLIQCARVALGFGGIYDEDEAQRIEQAGAAPVNVGMVALQDDLKQLAAERQQAGAQPAQLEHVQDPIMATATRIEAVEKVAVEQAPADAGTATEAAPEPRGDEPVGGAGADNPYAGGRDPGPIEWPVV